MSKAILPQLCVPCLMRCAQCICLGQTQVARCMQRTYAAHACSPMSGQAAASDVPACRFEEYVGQSALAAELVAQGVAASQKGKVAQAATQGVETIRLV